MIVAPGKDESQVFPDAVYECVRCGTQVAGKELSKLPSPTCANCGYRVFRKVEGRAPRKVKAD